MRRVLRTAAAVALACPALAQDGGVWRRPPQLEVDRAIERGVAHLRAGWEEENAARLRRGQAHGASRSGERALLGYTLLKSGVAPDDPAVRQLVAELAFEEIGQTYDVACTLLLLEAQDARAHGTWIAELARSLLATLHEYGWGYPGGHDLSNTQYGALGLWAAARAGVRIPPSAWRQLSSAVTNYGTKRGGFAYSSGVDGGATGSMTAAGVGTLALCEMELARAGALDSAWAWIVHGERARALAWLRGEFAVTYNPGHGGWTYYWLYGLERMAAWCGLRNVGAHDWYGEGAGWLVATQDDEGAWQGRVQTCFALLFLKRAALASLAPPTGLDVGTRGEADTATCRSEPGASVRFEARPWGERTAFRLLGLRRPVAEALEWPGDERRGPRVLRVEYLADGEVIAVGIGSAFEPMLGRSFPASARVDRGVRELGVRVHALVPPGRPGSERGSDDDPAVAQLESTLLRCEVGAGTLPERDVAEVANLLAPKGLLSAAEASSTLRGFDDLPGIRFGAQRALDGRARRPWLAREGDERPTLRISLRRAVRADTLYVHAARLSGYGPDELARPLELLVRIDDERELRVPMSPDPSRPARVELGAPLDLRELELTVLSRVPGRRGAVVGLGEVVLTLEADD